MLRSILLFLFATIFTFTYGLKGKILSCSGWKLNSHPHVKKFLKEFEYEDYQNVEVEYDPGKPAILTISDDDGNAIEEVNLFEIETNEQIHKMMIDKGFTLKPASEIAEIKVKRAEENGILTKQEIKKMMMMDSGIHLKSKDEVDEMVRKAKEGELKKLRKDEF